MMKRLVIPKKQNMRRKWKSIKRYLRNLKRREQQRTLYIRRLRKLHKRKKMEEYKRLCSKKRRSQTFQERKETAKLNRTLKRRRRR